MAVAFAASKRKMNGHQIKLEERLKSIYVAIAASFLPVINVVNAEFNENQNSQDLNP